MKPKIVLCSLLPLCSAAGLAAQDLRRSVGDELATSAPRLARQRVFLDEPGDGRIWAAGATYKASFGAEGFTYVPNFGSAAPRNFPVRFELRSVRVGGEPLALHAPAKLLRGEQAVTLQRGAVQERYDLALECVEQSFVIDARQSGDVEVEVAVFTELREDPTIAGLQFANEHGRVDYGAAYLVAGAERHAIETEWTGESLRFRVPAASRVDGPVVIDPILATTAFGSTRPNNSYSPDVAYDATNDLFLVVWEYEYSVSDHDIWSEAFTGSGARIPFTEAAFDISTITCGRPRIANLNAYDLFMCVFEHWNPNVNAFTQIFARRRTAYSGMAMAATFQVSDTAPQGHNLTPDIGGDPYDGPLQSSWCIAWMTQYGPSDAEIFARTYRGDTSSSMLNQALVASRLGYIYGDPQVSQSNGGGQTGTPAWAIVYSLQYNASDWDVYGATMDGQGNFIRTNRGLDISVASDRYPSVSSPLIDFGGPFFVVTYERQSPSAAAMALVVDRFLSRVVPPTDLSAIHGIGAYWLRTESDGCRFAVVSGAATITMATLALQNGAFVLHEAPQNLTGVPSFPRPVSKRSGGGVHTEYAVAYVDEAASPDRILLTTYSGRQPGGTIARRVMGCGGLGIDAAGRVFLGESWTAALTNASGVSGMLLGLPLPASTVLCSACPLGVDIFQPHAALGATSMSFPVPCDAILVGFTFSLQGYSIGTGPCLGVLRLSDTLDVTVR